MPKSEYYKTRLEHTSQDTRGYTRLIYMINGAVLALLFVAIQHGDKLADPVLITRGGLLVLAFINTVHGLFIFRQRHWYRQIDAQYAAAVDAKPVRSSDWFSKWYLGGHALYAYIHFVLALALLLAAIFAQVFVGLDGSNDGSGGTGDH